MARNLSRIAKEKKIKYFLIDGKFLLDKESFLKPIEFVKESIGLES